MRRPWLSIVVAPTNVAAVRTIALRLGARSTDRQQGGAAGGDGRGRSIGDVTQPASVTTAIVAMMKRNLIASPYIEKTIGVKC